MKLAMPIQWYKMTTLSLKEHNKGKIILEVSNYVYDNTKDILGLSDYMNDDTNPNRSDFK